MNPIRPSVSTPVLYRGTRIGTWVQLRDGRCLYFRSTRGGTATIHWSAL